MAEFCHPEFGCDCSEDKSRVFVVSFTMYGEDAQRGVLGIVEDLNEAINRFGLLGGSFRVMEADH